MNVIYQLSNKFIMYPSSLTGHINNPLLRKPLVNYNLNSLSATIKHKVLTITQGNSHYSSLQYRNVSLL